MNKNPLVSVIVPIYGVEPYIEKCARSLFEQSLENMEFIFVNDCTPDKSVEILRQVIEDYPRRYLQIQIIEHEENRGLAMARNSGLLIAKGEYIIPVSYTHLYNIFAVLAGLLSNVWTLHLYIPRFSFKQYAWLVLCRTVCVGSLTFFATYFFSKLFDAGWTRLICVGLFSTILLLVTTYFILMTNRERKLLKLRLL